MIAPESRHRPDSLDAHPLVREHFGAQLKGEYSEAWREGNNRLYEYYKSTAKEFPDTLEEMAPLYAAVIHGCQAELHEEVLYKVFFRRIIRMNEHFSEKRLGAFAADLAAWSAFFESPWRVLVNGLKDDAKGFILITVGYDLRALSRLAEASQPMQTALEIAIVQEDWKRAASRSSNLSELYLAIGDVKGALAYAEQSIQFADKSEDAFERISRRTTFADALHQAGLWMKSQSVFHEAEKMQRKFYPQYPILYSLWGFRYCDLLLLE